MEQKILTFLLALLPTFLMLHLLNMFFWATGLGIIIILPLIFIINIIVIIVGLTVASHLKKIYKRLVWGAMILITLIVPMYLWPQEYLPNVFKQIENSISNSIGWFLSHL
ncbi:hypothetical protein [Rummeliibacillus pycnus]|uniref:hypothetical protein n=1 Tax=Rummeliibacillus pycnus TaxID=101070 RepID=UPI003D2A6AF3